jgi:type I restriction enzyme S subunit
MTPRVRSSDHDVQVDTPIAEGWVWTRVFELGKFGTEAVKTGPFGAILKSKEFVRSGVPILAVGNVQSGQLDLEGARVDHVSEAKAADLSDYCVCAGDVLFTRSGTIGRSAVVPRTAEGWLMSYHLLRVRADQHLVNPQYLYFVFSGCEASRRYTDESVIGTTRPGINTQILENLPVPLPPRAEQERIVAKSEELRCTISSARNHLSRVLSILKRFRQAALTAACSGRLTEDWRSKQTDLTPVSQSLDNINRLRREISTKDHGTDNKYVSPRELETDSLSVLPDGWEYVSSDALFSFVTSGSRGWAQYYADAGPMFVRIGNLDHGSIELDLAEVQRVQPPEGLEQRRTAVREGDILISITADVGMVGLIPPAFGHAHINQHIALARPVNPWYSRYLAWYLASDDAQAQFLALQRGATKVGLGLEDIKSVAIPFPPQEEQREIVRRLESLLRIADEIQTRVAAASRHSEKLTQSILAKAFRGELVPTEAELARREGREYEPASVLLERIRAERANHAQTSASPKRRLRKSSAHV